MPPQMLARPAPRFFRSVQRDSQIFATAKPGGWKYHVLNVFFFGESLRAPFQTASLKMMFFLFGLILLQSYKVVSFGCDVKIKSVGTPSNPTRWALTSHK